MTTTILVSPAAAGKTRYGIYRIRQVLRDQPRMPVWVVVRDRLQVVAFRRRLAAAGGAMGVHIGTFEGLYREILERAGRPVPIASGPIVHRLVHAAVQEVRDQGGLTYYAPIADRPGFLQTLQERFAELKRARITPEVLLEYASGHSRGLVELARLYAAYQSRLRTLGWADPEGLNWLAVEALEQDPNLVADWALLVVDGFDAFNGAQHAALRLLSQALPEVLITLPGTPDMDREAYRRFARALETLQAELSATVKTLADPPHLPAPLAHLEHHLFETAAPAIPAGKHVSLLQVPSPAYEAREALRWLKARIVRDGVPADACAIFTPDPERYRPHLRAAGEEFGLPLRFTYGEPLSQAPGIVALLDLLELPLQNFPRRLTLEAIRSPYFDLTRFGLEPRDALALEAVSQYGQVIEGLDQWEEALRRLAARDTPPQVGEDEEAQLPHLPWGEAAHALWQHLRAFATRLTLPQAQPIHAWVSWLEDLLDALGRGVPRPSGERAETPRDQAAFLKLRETLRALVLGERVAGETVLDGPAFVAELRGTLDATIYREQVDWSQSAILVSGILEARGLRFQAVAVLGLSEGLFPEVEREDPFLDEAIRQALGLEPRLGRGQSGLFYQLITRADQHLLLTRPYLADDGERWEPSPYWRAVTSLIAEEPQRLRPDAPRPLADAASAEEALFWAVRRRALPANFAADLRPRWEYLRHARDVLIAHRAWESTGPLAGHLGDLAEELSTRFGPQHVWSPSRLEAYGTCPYRFYGEVVLGLEAREPPEPGLDARQLGSLLHTILERTYQEAEDPGDPESVLVALQAVAAEEFQAAPERYSFRPTPLWEVEQAQLLDALTNTVRSLAELGGTWTPVAFERTFGIGEVPPLEVPIGVERVRVHGIIDRVDRSPEGKLRIIDYKTGAGHLGRSDLIEGRRLQLPLYALAARESLGMGEVVEGLYWAILSSKAFLHLSRFQHEDEDGEYTGPHGAMELVRSHVERIVAGARAGSYPPRPPRGGCPSYCAAAAWCWRYTPERR
jgi:ATP-dependent helicase/DNAse subunit B